MSIGDRLNRLEQPAGDAEIARIAECLGRAHDLDPVELAEEMRRIMALPDADVERLRAELDQDGDT